MAVALQTSATSSADATPITITKPTGTTENDFLLAHIHWRAAVTVNSVPTGWTLLGTVTPGGDDRGSVYYKKAGASEPANYAWGWSSGAAAAAGGIIRISGQDPSFAFGADGTNWTRNADTTGNEITTDVGITPTRGNSLIVIFAGDGGTNLGTYTIATSNPGMTEVYEVDGTDVTAACATGLRPESTATGLGQAVNSTGGGRGEIFLLAVSPAAAASGPANLKTYNTNVKANIKSINTNVIANVKSLNTNT